MFELMLTCECLLCTHKDVTETLVLNMWVHLGFNIKHTENTDQMVVVFGGVMVVVSQIHML